MQGDEHEWEELARLDPLWAVLSERDRKSGRWSLAEFFATGEEEVERILALVARLGLPGRRDRALDFGCGVGRTTRALAARFEEVLALDISPTMIEQARRINAGLRNVSFVVASLDEVERSSYDLVWSLLVLQHLTVAEAESAVESLTSLLRPGGAAVFQLPYAARPLHRLQLSRRSYRILRSAGVSATTIHRRTPLTPMRMSVVPHGRVAAAVDRGGGRVVAVEPYGAQDVHTPSSLYVATRSRASPT
jgi:SAM-dependent methyltransferase